MANATIKITQLPSIGNALSVSTVFPVVDTTGTAITEKTTLGSIANLILTQAGVSLPAAFVSEIAYSVANAAQPNITSVGTLNINTLHVSGGTNGQYLQTDGTGNLTWVSGGGSGNGVVGGANAQLQFNNEGNFGGDAGLTWAGDTGVLSTLKLSVSSNATIYGNTALTNLNVAGNLTTNNIFTDNYYYANGYVFGGGGGNGVPGGSNTQVQFNDNGVFGGNTGFTFDKTIGILSSPFLAGNGNGLSNIQGANVSGFVPNANVANTAFAVAGANVSGAVTYAATANSVAVANVVGIGNIAVLALDGSTSNVLYGNGVFAPASGGGNTGNVTFDNVTVQGVNGLNLSAGSDFTANLAYLQVRAGDVASHIHLDTGNNSAYDLIVGDDQNYVQVSSTGNILLSSYDSNTSQYTWTLDYNGNLILAGGNSVIRSIANSSLDILNPNVSTMVLTPDPGYSSQALVLDPTSVGHIHLRSPGSNIDQPSANLFLGGEVSSFEVGQYNGAVPNLFIHSNNNTWTFDIDGNLTLPQLTTIRDESEIGTTLTVGAPPTVIVISGADVAGVNLTYTRSIGITPPTWTSPVVNPASDPYITFDNGVYGIIAPDYGTTPLYVNTGTLNVPLTQWNTNPPLGSVAPTAVYTYGASGPGWVFGDDGLLTLPGGNVVIGSLLGSEAILASNIAFGVVSQGNGSTVLQWIDDVSNSSALSAIYINSPSGNTGDVAVLTGEPGANANIWTFGNNGNLTLPTGGQIIVSGGLVSSGASPAPSINGFSITNSVGISGNGNIAGGNISTTGNITGNTNGFTIGYLNIPQVTASDTTLALSDAGKHYYSTTAGNFTLTVPNNTTTSFATGTAISIVVQAAGNILVNAASGVTLFMAGNSTAANRVVGGYGMATLMKVATDTWFINGTGVA